VRAGDNFFSDVFPDHANFGAITALRTTGVIQGFPDGTFRPDIEVSRAEALKMMLLGSTITTGAVGSDPFPDVPRDEWYAPFVAAAKERKILQGTQAGTFEPERTVNQAEALKIILLLNEIPLKAAKSEEWFAPVYEQAKERSLLNGSAVNPGAALTRGELAQIMYLFAVGAKSHTFSIGTISYYGDGAQGSGTASGQTFDNTAFTAAHRVYEFGSRILLRALTTGKAVVAEIVDRGPYLPFRNADLSKSAFAAIDSLSAGLTKAEVQPISADTPLGAVDTLCTLPVERHTIPKNAFSGIALESEIPDLFRTHEIFSIRGKAAGAQEVTAFWRKGQEEEQRARALVTNGQFTLTIPFLAAGKFNFGIIPGTSGQASIFPITVADGECLRGSGTQPAAIANLRGEINQGNFVLKWDDPGKTNFYRILFTQEEKTLEFFVHNSMEFMPPPQLFTQFISGPAEVRVFAAGLNSLFSADIASPFSASQKMNLNFSQHYFADTDSQKITLESAAEEFNHGEKVRISGKFSAKLQPKAVIIVPDGSITEIPLTLSGQNFSLEFTAQIMGTHIVEINADTGIAVYNAPVYPRGLTPLLPDYFDLHSRDTAARVENIDLAADRAQLLALMNAEREKAGLAKLAIQNGLNELAQLRAEDMQQRDYFAHITPEGKTVSDLKVGFGIRAAVSENIAFDVNLESAHEGLLRSPLHRHNLLNADWEFVGIGITKNDVGGVIIAEVFSSEILSNARRPEYSAQILSTLNDRREEPLTTDATLTKIAENWAEKMVQENFFSAKAPDGQNLQDVIKKEKISGALQTAFYQYEGLGEFLEVLKKREDSPFLTDENLTKIGIGMYIDEAGTLTVVLLLQEE